MPRSVVARLVGWGLPTRRDFGYAIGALLPGVTTDALGLPAAIWLVAGLAFSSGLVVALRMRETLR